MHCKRLLIHLIPSILLTIGLSIFTQSFFLSRTSFDHRASCDIEAAGTLLSTSLGLEQDHVDYLRSVGFLSDYKYYDSSSTSSTTTGCWTPRRVDSMVILVVDALRFDFARDHLPLSIGSRLFTSSVVNNSNNTTSTASEEEDNKYRGTSKLYQFVADPPTVTMQRLKGLTTGGLPTFADISGSFGGANVDEDSWVEQLKNVPWNRRRRSTPHTRGLQKKSEEEQRTDPIMQKEDDETKPQLAFVGDDTWVDLFPTQFDDCHPFPSFNTRDLDTVDNGCLMHLPRLLDGLIGLTKPEENEDESVNATSSSEFELIVAHFLGVDHVGHTYGPNNPHMERKLHQMDVMLSNTLNTIDDAPQTSCIVALVLGDHGMTEDGNHGGGTSDEVNAGLFVHFSPGCRQNEREDRVKGDEMDSNSARVFESIHQIDVVPTISFLLGLPVPYANIGGLVPDLLPSPLSNYANQQKSNSAHIATALALNAAQVWNYLHTYSQISRDLPLDRLNELKELLDSASFIYRDAIIQSQKHTKDINNEENFFDSTAYRQACGMFKTFLSESTDMGKQVWTQFNERGMMIGIAILVVAWIMGIPLWKRSVRNELFVSLFIMSLSKKGQQSNNESIKENRKGNGDGLNSSLRPYQRLEFMTAMIFVIFQCGVLTFGNSYIEHEREIVTFFLAILCLLVFRRWCFVASSTQHSPATSRSSSSVYIPLMVILCARINDVFVTGHGLDPSIRLHVAHHPIVFLSSLFLLMILRTKWLANTPTTIVRREVTPIPRSSYIDVVAIVCLAGSWLEKRSRDHSRNGFILARIAIIAVFVGFTLSLFNIARQWSSKRHKQESWIEHAQLTLFRIMLLLVIVTGPSSASTSVLIILQCASLRQMMESTGAPVMAAIWRLAIRHVFFATNHHCSFNRLQFSAAFVATDTFQFFIAGSSLFINTFGWEILGSCLVLVYSRSSDSISSKSNASARKSVWDWFCYFQWTEILTSCISVSVMKRHLMVWAIFAPRFMFAAVFTGLSLVLLVLDLLLA